MTNDRQRAQDLLNRADKILAAVDDSYIIKERGHRPRPMPMFRHTEIELGRTLGAGGFGVVNEVTAFDLEKEPEISTEGEKEEESKKEDGDSKKVAISNTPGGDLYEDDAHYEVSVARELMANRCLRRGVTRYALKRLHDNLSEVEKARGMIDLAVEAKYLSVVWHPNIVKMRGVAAGSYLNQDFFIVMDRLFGTLDQRINAWKKLLSKNSGCCCGFGKNHEVFMQVLKERMIVAYDLAVAFMYLHENRLVYRDIKPENIGFDVRGDVKVFDFGLCKDLEPRLKCKDGGYGYKLTGRAGSLPYMVRS
ncbi:Inhibitor of nuclear factor kappa-B kinase subunit beta [Seminavis robusta]|uniref:Inhibitor of nuclear factor kappa-B kinase subunit beta n=1 Tax=Seminavis robusta TaxID=568900 RepID=A0A9N8DAS5_9STRA|nr:Inhibitor of nuclear factor kappa-B kinase subunit beta [Seminavis robusta]|eukprot:Sro37_g023070.1 Inhibitor of nuclear factor kappa-B kinase subunit beta (307) ;mRNA; r:20636-21948